MNYEAIDLRKITEFGNSAKVLIVSSYIDLNLVQLREMYVDDWRV